MYCSFVIADIIYKILVRDYDTALFWLYNYLYQL